MKTKEDIIFEQVGLEGTLKRIGCYDAVLKAMTDFAKQTQTKNCNIHGVSESAFEIKPISMELSESLKQHLASIEEANKLAETLVSKFGIPEKYFGNHSH